MDDSDRATRIWSVGMDLRAMERAQRRRRIFDVDEVRRRQAERRRYGAVVEDEDPEHDTLDWADR